MNIGRQAADFRVKVEDVKNKKTMSFSVHLNDEKLDLRQLRNMIVESMMKRGED